MIHYSCDRCQKSIDDQALRYVVRMEMHAECEEIDSPTPDESQLEQMQEILADLGEENGEELLEDVFRRHRFDLCDECYKCFKEDPLGAGRFPKIRFSQN
ncbi:MAG: hypothetical protein P8M80_09740 [Pirellulaceae bacterium]|nr:hypothetical protein [Pirellulaceae bacterium]